MECRRKGIGVAADYGEYAEEGEVDQDDIEFKEKMLKDENAKSKMATNVQCFQHLV